MNNEYRVLAQWSFPIFMLGLVFGIAVFSMGASEQNQKTIVSACGPCDNVAQCGKFVCRAGVDGWHIGASP